MIDYSDKLRSVLEQADKLRNEADELQALLGSINGSIFINPTGLMCDTNVQELVYDLITYNIDGIMVANDEVNFATPYHKVQIYVNVLQSDTPYRQVTITLRDNGCNSNLVIGSALVSKDKLNQICEDTKI